MPIVYLFRKLFVAGILLSVATTAAANVYTVTTREDSKTGSLRYQVQFGANMNPGPDTIVFDIQPSSNSITVYSTINISGSPVHIQGYGQTLGASAKTFPLFTFDAGSDGSTLTGMALVDAGTGVLFYNSHGVTVEDCRIGTDFSDSASRGCNVGIDVRGDYHLIGGADATKRNIIANCSQDGIRIQDPVSNIPIGTRVMNNYIGTNSTGLAALGNGNGINMQDSAAAVIGGMFGTEGNLISGNVQDGIFMNSADCFGTTIVGNIIGLDVTQSTAIPNVVGVRMYEFTNYHYIGLAQANDYNVIAGNTDKNIWIGNNNISAQPHHIYIQNNFIGVNSSSQDGFASNIGIFLDYTNHILIGGERNAATLQRNIISGNNGPGTYSPAIGLLINDSISNSIMGNYIGTDAAGMNARPNGDGILISGLSQDNDIGGGYDVSIPIGNIVSGNANRGIAVPGGTNIRIMGNIVGLTLDGTAALANGSHGIDLHGTYNYIGDEDVEKRNIIAGNGSQGININATFSDIIGNYIGVNSAGTAAVDNGNNCSIYCYNNYNDFESNYATDRFYFTNGCLGNTITGNTIGILPNGAAAGITLGNGIYFDAGAGGNYVGTVQTGAGNLIANITGNGVEINGAATGSIGIFGNTIVACSNKAIAHTSGGNSNKSAPVITVAVAGQDVVGTAGAGDYIEVFIAEGSGGNGGSKSFVGYTYANGAGNWSLIMPSLATGQAVCALATDSSNNTSEFSANVAGVMPTHSATPTVTLTPTPTPTQTATLTVTPTNDNPFIPYDLKGKTTIAFPNPARNEMRFLFHIKSTTTVMVEIYNLSGEEVSSVSGHFEPGAGQILTWNCRDVAYGIYLARVLMDGEEKQKIKLAIVK